MPVARRRIALVATRYQVVLLPGGVLPAEPADRALGRLAAAVEETGLREPALFRLHGDATEAKVALGQLDGAEALLAQLDGLGATLERPWVLVMACRGRVPS